MKLETLISSCLSSDDLSIDFQNDSNIFSFHIENKILFKVMSLLKQKMSSLFLLDISAIEDKGDISKNGPHLRYLFIHLDSFEYIEVMTTLDQNRKGPGFSQIWPNARWHEQELFDFHGVCMGDNSKRLILPEDFSGHPLQKKYLYKSNEGYFKKRRIKNSPKRTLAIIDLDSLQFCENGYLEKEYLLNGRKIVDAKLLLGFEHRGIEKICEKNLFPKPIFL